MRLANDIRIKFRTTGISVTISSGLSQFLGDSRSDHEIIPQLTAFRQYIAERIQNHRATVLDLIIITPDRIGEYHIYRIVVRLAGSHFISQARPFSHRTPVARKSDRLPGSPTTQDLSNQPRGRGEGGTHCHVRHEMISDPNKARGTDILYDIIIVANQYATFPSLDLKNHILNRPARYSD